MLFCINRWECAAKIEADLAAGKIIVCDRYSASGVAYSAAKGASTEFCVGCEAGLPQPDLVIFLFVKPEVTALRPGYNCDTDRHEVLEFQKLVAARYLSSEVTSMTKNWSTVNADRSTDEVALDVYRIATEAIDNLKKSERK
jgi:dTMP kinase